VVGENLSPIHSLSSLPFFHFIEFKKEVSTQFPCSCGPSGRIPSLHQTRSLVRTLDSKKREELCKTKQKGSYQDSQETSRDKGKGAGRREEPWSSSKRKEEQQEGRVRPRIASWR